MDVLTIVIAFLGGLGALFSKALLERLSHAFNRAKERDALLRLKAEEVVVALLDHRTWFLNNFVPGNETALMSETDLGYSRAKGFQKLYFPACAAQFEAISNSYSDAIGYLAGMEAPDPTDPKEHPIVRRTVLLTMHLQKIDAAVEALCVQMEKLIK